MHACIAANERRGYFYVLLHEYKLASINFSRGREGRRRHKAGFPLFFFFHVSSSTFSIFHHMDAGSSKSDIIKAPSVTLFGDTSTCGQDSFQDTPRGRRRRCYAYLRRHRPYLSGLAIRLATLIVIVGVLIGLGLGLQYTEGMPRAEDFSHLTFDWQIDPRSFLSPFNSTFGSYNVLLDGHSHSTYSDGKMNVEQLLDWHLGKFR